MATYYHVCRDEWDGGDLISLYQQEGEEAYQIYAERWPEAGELAQYHVHYVHLYATLDEAKEHQGKYGGEILVITGEPEEIGIESDDLEFPHPVVKHRIFREYISWLEI